MRQRRIMLLFGVLLASLFGEAGAVNCFLGNATLPLCSDAPCYGGCTFENGCLCDDAHTVCVPSPDLSCDIQQIGPAMCCPPGLYWYPADSCCSAELYCDPPCLSDEVCTDIYGVAECLCNKTIYLYATLSDLIPAVTCKASVARLEFLKCLLERFYYDYTTWHYLNNSADCMGIYTPDTAGGEALVFTEPLMKTGWCGNVVTIADGMVTYSNTLYIPFVDSGIISSNPLNLSFSCTYNLTMQTSLDTALHPIIRSVIWEKNSTGSVNATMVVCLDSMYTVPYDAASLLSVGTKIYILIFTDFADRDRFALRAEHCWASPTSDGRNPVDLISGGCAVSEATNTQVESNGVGMEVTFSLDMFVFQAYPEVYMFCTVRLCEKLTDITCTGCTSA